MSVFLFDYRVKIRHMIILDYLLIQYEFIKCSHSNSMSTFEEVDDKINEWISQEQGWSMTRIDSPTYRRGYKVKITNGKELGVIIERIKWVATIQTTVNIPEDLKNSYKLVPTVQFLV